MNVYQVKNGVLDEHSGREVSMIVVSSTPAGALFVAEHTTWPGKIDADWTNLTVEMIATTSEWTDFANVTEPKVTSIYGVLLNTWTTDVETN